MLPNGLYEQVINKAIEEELAKGEKISKTEEIDAAESSKILSAYVADIVAQSLEYLKDSGFDTKQQVAFVNKIIESAISNSTGLTSEFSVSERAEQLLAIIDKQNNINAIDPKAEIVRPVTSIARSSIFTGAKNEPQMYTELKKEIVSCNRIEMIVSFIKWSGLRLLIDELRQFAANGGELRIITTSYMGATDIKAIEELYKLPNTKIKVSYDTKITRLHAKAYIFYRDTGFTTAYVGSSNMSNAALTSGLEWNLKITQKDSPDTVKKIAATFESNWNSSEFEYYDEGQNERLSRALKAERYHKNDNTNQCQTSRRNLQEKQNQIRGEVKTIHEEVNHYDAETERSSTRMAKDDEYIMSCFKEFVSTRAVLITFYEMDTEQVASFNTNVLRVERNANPNDFPDFVGESMYVEVFNVSSSKEKRKGAQYFKENTELEKRMEEALKLPDDPDERKRGKTYAETLEYTGHSYDYWLSSLQRNIQSHKASRLKYSPKKNTEGVFLVRYSQKVLSYNDENDVEQWHRLGVDKKALSIIANELTGLIDYFILFNEKNSEAEVFPITKIPSYLCSHKLDYNFYPRKGAGEIRIGISEIIEPISFS